MDQLDLDAAVHAGVLRPEQADALRRFDERQRHAPSATEERFAFISGFADVMATVGLLMVALTAMVMVGLSAPLGCVLFPLLCWWAATYFTARRRMMLSSFVIFGVFALSVAMTALAVVSVSSGLSPLSSPGQQATGLALFLTSAVTCLACLAYWRRFRLPIAFAAFAVALVNLAMNLLKLAFPDLSGAAVSVLSATTGPTLFAWAMWWDMSDVRRETVRSDVAFWLHIAAGFLIVKSAMALLLGTEDSVASWGRLFTVVAEPASAGQSAAVLVLFLLFAVVALIIDRRALLTSGMFYAVPAAATLLGPAGGSAIGPAFLMCGAMLTVLAIHWTHMRQRLLPLLPIGLAAQLPRAQPTGVGARPVY